MRWFKGCRLGWGKQPPDWIDDSEPRDASVFRRGGWTPPWARLKGDGATLSFDQRPEAEIVSHFSSTVISCSTTRRLSGCLSLCPSRAAIWPPPRRRGCEWLCGANDPILLVEAGRCDVDRRVKWGAMRHLPDSTIGQPQLNFVVSHADNSGLNFDAARHFDRYFGTRLDWARRVSWDRRNLFQAY